MSRKALSVLSLITTALLVLLLACSQPSALELEPLGSGNAKDVIKVKAGGEWNATLVGASWDPPVACCVERIEGRAKSVDGRIRGRSEFLFDAVSVTPAGDAIFPGILDAERLWKISCLTALDGTTVAAAGEVFNVGEVPLLPPGIWFLAVFEERAGLPDRISSLASGDADTILEMCLNAKAVVPTLEPFEEFVGTTGEHEVTVRITDDDGGGE